MQIEFLNYLLNGEDGLLLVSFYFLYQLLGSHYLPWQTTVDKIISRVEQRINSVEETVGEVQELQKAHMQITKATTQVKNPKKELDHTEIDKYYKKNGVEAEDFVNKNEEKFVDDDTDAE